MNEEKTYSLAGLKVKITGKQTVCAIDRLPGFGVFEINDRNYADVRIRVDQEICEDWVSVINPVHKYSVLEIDHILSSFSNGYFFEMRKRDGNRVVSMIYDRRTNDIVMSSCDCELSLRFAIWVAYSFVSVSKNIVSIHASAIVKNGTGVLFLGESGTGKSTHTGLWMRHIEGSYLLNDDSPLLRINGDKVLAYGSPWSGKTHCYRQEGVPIKAMVRLRQGPRNKISKLGLLKSIGAIYPSCPPLFAYDSMLAGRMIGTIDKIVTRTPVYMLECLPDSEAVQIVYNAIY